MGRTHARVQPTIITGVWIWSVWQPERNLAFNSFFIAGPEGNLAIDPLPLTDADAREIAARGGLAWVVVTNRDHERDARAIAARFGAKIAASAPDVALLAGPVDRALAHGDEIGGARVIGLHGFKTPGECALYFADLGTVVVGDALWGAPAGALSLMPDEKLADPRGAALSLRAVAAVHPRHVLVGDGACVFGNATAEVWKTLDARALPEMRVINVDDAVWRTWPDEPSGFGGSTFEVGDFIGSEKLGYRVARIEPGAAFCPLHWHTLEEEVFYVMRGTATLVTPHGSTCVRAGDFVHFPTTPVGAHKVSNESSEPCDILMVACNDLDDICSYPDSQKVLVDRRGLMLRDHPDLDYYDGEVAR